MPSGTAGPILPQQALEVSRKVAHSFRSPVLEAKGTGHEEGWVASRKLFCLFLPAAPSPATSAHHSCIAPQDPLYASGAWALLKKVAVTGGGDSDSWLDAFLFSSQGLLVFLGLL